MHGAEISTTPSAGAAIVKGFGSTEMKVQAELAATAAAEQARAITQARYVMALQRPRDVGAVRERILEECRRPRFADSAIYAKPVGGKSIEGLSVRFAEAALRQMGNVLTTTIVTYDDRDKRVLRVMCTDLETNSTFEEDAVIEKTVERKSTKGRENDVIAERVNSYGEKVYILRATEDELATKAAAVVSKKVRNCGLRLIPGDVKDEAKEACEVTLGEETKRDLPGKRQRMVAAFGALHPPVSPAALGRYLGHDPLQATVEEMVELAHVKSAIEEGETTWAATLDERVGGEKKAPTVGPVPTVVPGARPDAAAVEKAADQLVKETEAATSARAQEHTSPNGKVTIKDEPEQQAAPAEAPITQENPASEPPAGSADFAAWLIAQMKDAAKRGVPVRDLAKLSTRVQQCPKEKQAEVRAAYETCRFELTSKR